MGRAIDDSGQLVGSAAIAERLGFKSSTLVHWWRTHDETFPDPLVRLAGNVMIWYWPDVEDWAKNSTRLGSKARRSPQAPPAGEVVADGKQGNKKGGTTKAGAQLEGEMAEETQRRQESEQRMTIGFLREGTVRT